MVGDEDATAGEPAVEPVGVRVTVELDWDALEPGVVVELCEAGEGAAVGSPEFQAWVRGAVQGVRFAQAETQAMPCVVRVVELAVGAGAITPAHVAAAAAFAVWEALGVEPAPESLARVHTSVARSASEPPDWLGCFERPRGRAA